MPAFDRNQPDADDTGTGKKTDKKRSSGNGFESMGLSQAVYKAIIRKGYRVPTPIQRKVINLVKGGRDVVAMARTGSGKTAAFIVPMLEQLQEHAAKFGTRGIILTPTRELAMQTLKFARELGAFTNLRTCLLIGGESLDDQFAALAANPDIIIATPGRLMHHLEQTDMTLSEVQLCVFDEADRLFEMGFAEQIKEIMKSMPEHRQTCLFSATLPQILADFTSAGLHNPELVRLDIETKISDTLKVTFFTVRSEQKDGALLSVIREFVNAESQQTIIFAATKHHVEFIALMLKKAGFSCSIVYGELDPAARKLNIGKFRAKKAQFLIVTDVAARGIDIPLLDNVINYDFPMTPKLFVHRVGRAARAGRSGTAFSLVAYDEMPYLLDVHLFLGSKPANVCPAGASTHDPSTVLYGTLPADKIDAEQESIRQWLHSDSWFRSLVCHSFRLALLHIHRALQFVAELTGDATGETAAECVPGLSPLPIEGFPTVLDAIQGAAPGGSAPLVSRGAERGSDHPYRHGQRAEDLSAAH
jgi:ATP-dependent RNA helicase DDX54/DBP10